MWKKEESKFIVGGICNDETKRKNSTFILIKYAIRFLYSIVGSMSVSLNFKILLINVFQIDRGS